MESIAKVVIIASIIITYLNLLVLFIAPKRLAAYQIESWQKEFQGTRLLKMVGDVIKIIFLILILLLL